MFFFFLFQFVGTRALQTYTQNKKLVKGSRTWSPGQIGHKWSSDQLRIICAISHLFTLVWDPSPFWKPTCYEMILWSNYCVLGYFNGPFYLDIFIWSSDQWKVAKWVSATKATQCDSMWLNLKSEQKWPSKSLESLNFLNFWKWLHMIVP